MINSIKHKILLRPSDIKPSSDKFEVSGVLNPGAARLKNGNIVLYARVIEKLIKNEDNEYFYSPRFNGKEGLNIQIDRFKKDLIQEHTDLDFSFKDKTKRLTYISHLRRIILDKSGFKVLKIDKKPSFFGLSWDCELGVEDPRITKLEDLYCMTYVGLTRKENISTSLALSNNGIRWYRRGIIFGEQDKDTVLFPEKINGNFVIFDRPEGNFEFTPPHIWIAYSKDLEYWGKLKAISFLNRDNLFVRSGAGPPPIKTKQGWLLIFHAVTEIPKKGFLNILKKTFGKEERIESYAVWAALFDLKNPEKLIALSSKPILSPKSEEEKSPEGKNVIFPTGIIEDKAKKEILLYSGIGDQFVGVSRIRLQDILNSLEKIK